MRARARASEGASESVGVYLHIYKKRGIERASLLRTRAHVQNLERTQKTICILTQKSNSLQNTAKKKNMSTFDKMNLDTNMTEHGV